MPWFLLIFLIFFALRGRGAQNIKFYDLAVPVAMTVKNLANAGA
jgi:hypothetical protein